MLSMVWRCDLVFNEAWKVRENMVIFQKNAAYIYS